MSEFRILENWLFDSTVEVSASSANAEFPVSNLTKPSRAKVWRSSGTFVIDASNNKIDFKTSSLGSEKTATIPSGSYTPSQLADAIELALILAGSDPMSVTYAENTGLWTLTSSGSYLDILIASGTNVASSLMPYLGFNSGYNLTGSLTYTSHEIAIHTEESLLVDLQTFGTNPVDSVALIFDPQTGSRFTSQAVIKIQANQVNVWSSPVVDVTLNLDETYGVYTHFFSTRQSYRFWRLKIVDSSNPSLYVEVPKLLLSNSIQLTQVPALGFELAISDRSDVMMTKYGHIYTDNYPMLSEFKCSYSALTEADTEDLYELYQRVGNTVPFGVALDPTATVFDKDRFFLYGKFSSAFSIKHRALSYFDTGFTVAEVL